jgi:hypothetical protein
MAVPERGFSAVFGSRRGSGRVRALEYGRTREELLMMISVLADEPLLRRSEEGVRAFAYIARNCWASSLERGLEIERAQVVMERVGSELDKREWENVSTHAAKVCVRHLGEGARINLDSVICAAREGGRKYVADFATSIVHAQPQRVWTTLVPPAFLPHLQELTENAEVLDRSQWNLIFLEAASSLETASAHAMGLKLLEILRSRPRT